MSSVNFKDFGKFQQFGAFFVKVGRLIDGIIIFLSLFFLVKYSGHEWTDSYLLVAILGVLFFEVIASFAEFYRSWRMVRLRHEILEILIHWTCSCMLLTFYLYFQGKGSQISNQIIFDWYLVAFGSVVLMRAVIRMGLRYCRAFGYDNRTVCFIGANETAYKLFETFKQHPWMGMEVLGIFDDRKPTNTRPLAFTEESLTGNIDDLLLLAQKGGVDLAYICLPMAAEKRIQAVIQCFSDTATSIYFCPSFHEFDLLNARWDNVFGQPVISLIESPFSGYVGIIKRVQDLLLCSVILPLIAIPMGVISLAIKLTSKGPVIYKQKRYGLNGKEFIIWKFRTMTICENDGDFVQAKKGDSRITALGSFLRKTSLDELPQFINVLLGDMSVIGPRPHPVKLNEEHRRMVQRYMMRHIIKPGITGWAQVNGCRGETNEHGQMEQRIEYDLFYIKNWSFFLDVQIFFKTVFKVLFDKNAY